MGQFTGEIEQNLTAQWIEVLVDCPGATGLYTYGIPEDLKVRPGDIVSVSFGTQQVGAIALRLLDMPPEGIAPSSMKSIESVLSPAFFSQEYWQLLNRVASYYQTPFIRSIRIALPPGLLSKSQRRIKLIESLSEEKVDKLSISKSVSELAIQLIAILQKSAQGDLSWAYVQRQIKSPGSPAGAARQALNQALKKLIALGSVESYLAPPRSLSSQKRQAVVLIKPPATADLASAALSQRHQAILAALTHHGGELWLSDALQLLHTTSKTLKVLEGRGYLAIEPREVLRSSSHSAALPDRPKSLTGDQAQALAVLHGMEGYSEALLHGVTGSGKTEVYLQAIAPVLAAQKSALVLVPEIGLTPQLTDRFRSRFGDKVCIYHSGLSEGERYDTWRQMLTCTPQIIIGTRSAVFAPLPNLGILILDEEHDSSFKQDQPMPCYHAREVARWRAELENCPLILGSATPCLETWLRFQADRPDQPSSTQPTNSERLTDPLPPQPSPLPSPLSSLLPSPLPSPLSSPLPSSPAFSPPLHYLALPQRVHARPLPPIDIIDMRAELHEGNRTIFSRPLQKALESLIEKGNQGILFIHRRGHSSFVSCRSCGYVMECPHCDVSLSFHQPHAAAAASLRCHYCGYSQPQPKTCPQCASPYLKNFGSGTQRVVNDLAKYLPQARCIRFDSDTTRNKGAHRALLTRFAQGEADLLVGTQMLTKGIDLPQVTLVGVIAADGLLFMSDYRASERAFQTMTQVAGRAGRGEQPGRVIVQTYSPEHVAVKALTQQAQNPQAAYGDFLAAELRDRAALDYPPYGRLVLLRISGIDERASERAANQVARVLNELRSQLISQRMPSVADDEPSFTVMGPVPAPIFRVARRYRWHILIKLALNMSLPDLSNLQQQIPQGISLNLDVDPLNLS